MRVDVRQLFAAGIDVKSFGARKQAPYLDAAEEMRVAVLTTIDAEEVAPPRPYERCALTVICYTGKEQRDRRYRPEVTRSLNYIMEPFYTALLEAKVIASPASVVDERKALVRGSEHEGFRIIVNELAA